jgi:CDP-4-dehydro-6-deoxyglucose reductase, E3
MNTYTYKIQNLESLAPTITRLLLSPIADDCLHFQAGQYLEILYPDHTYQPFSIANAPQTNGIIELHIRHLPGDLATAALLDQLEQVNIATLRGSFGAAYYRRVPDRPIILLAGGTGFAYTKAIIEAAQQHQDQRSLHLYWGVKVATDFYLANLLQQFSKNIVNFQYTLIISQPQNNKAWSGKTGNVPATVIADYPDLSNYQVYGSGPRAMIIAAAALFQQHGLSKEFFYSDML